MDTALSADVQYFAQQSPEQIHLILSGMTALMQDTEGKMAAMQSQNWFQRMARTVTGRNKLTLEEIRQNHEKLNLYMAGVVTELYQQGRVDRRIMMSLGAQLNEIYADHVQLKQMLGAFVVKLNEKIDSVDNFHMLITEIEQGVYKDDAPLVGICKILSQFDRRTLDDTRKLDIIRRSLSSQNIICEEPVSLTGHLASVLDIPMSEAGQVYLELGSIRENFIASILMKMMENYHFLPDMARRTKSRKSLIEKVLREEDLDETIALSTQEIYDDFVSSKVEIQSGFLSLPHGSDFPATDADISETDIPKEDSAEKVSRYRTAAENGDPQAQYDLGVCYQNGDGVEQDIHTAIEWYRKAAAKGHADAQNRLGVRYDNGDGVEEDTQKAVFWFRKAAQQGHAKAQCNLGNCYMCGRGVEEDIGQAFSLFSKSAEQGFATAQCNLGILYMNGIGVEQDATQGFSWFRKAAEQGDATAQYYLGQCYLSGDGVREDEAQAFHWFQKSAEQGDIDAKFRLGDCFYYGFGVEENPQQAVPFYREAAENGHAGAQYALGLCYFFGNGVQENESEAVKWYRKSAEQGNSAAQFELGRCYHNGTGVQEDEGEAVSWFREAAEQGHAEAQLLMGTAFLTGSGVNKNPAQAVEWYRKSAEQGFSGGQFCLGACYFDGLGVEKNYIQALSLFRQAAEQDNAQALCMLGKCYESGSGVVKDMAQALQYYHQAAELGDADAQTCLGRCYMYGKGVPKNLRTAKDWLQMASNDGDELTHFLLAETYYALYIRDELGIDAMTIAKVIPFVNFGAFAIDGISRLGDADKTRTFLRTEEGAEMIRHYKIASELGHEGAKKNDLCGETAQKGCAGERLVS